MNNYIKAKERILEDINNFNLRREARRKEIRNSYLKLLGLFIIVGAVGGLL